MWVLRLPGWIDRMLGRVWWRWRTVHVAWSTTLELERPGAGAEWYVVQEMTQAKLAGRWQSKNTWDLVAGLLGVPTAIAIHWLRR